ncbi:MAG: signal peptidase I [Thiotrichaceae bacterium]
MARSGSRLKKRYGTVAVGMHLLAPGLGFLYAGRLWTALLIPLFLFLSVYFIGWSRMLLEPWGIWLILGALIFVYLFLIPAVFISARKNNSDGSISLKRSQQGVVYLVFTLIVLFVITFTVHFRATLFGYETFILPSRSMANTLLPNDHIIVDTWAYYDKKPKQGDILVFKYPLDPKIFYTKRMIAGSGDSVFIKKGKVLVNNIPLHEPYVLASNNQQTSKKNLARRTVADGYYFVLGDNRDHSNDSRYWGEVAEGAIYGKAVSIWFSSKTGVRKERIRSLRN